MIPPPDLGIVFGVWPTDLSFADLAAFIADFEQAVEVVAVAAGEVPNDSPVLSLVGVAEGSTDLQTVVAPRFKNAYNLLAHGLSVGGEAWRDVSRDAQRLATKAIGRLIDLGGYVRFDSHNDNTAGTRTFTASHPPPEVAEELYTTGETELAVEVIRAGGVRPRAFVRQMGSGDKFPVQGIHKQVIQDLGERLYKRAVIVGEATWRLPDWKVVGFYLRSVAPFPEQNPADTLAELRAALGPAAAAKGGLAGFRLEFRTDADEGE